MGMQMNSWFDFKDFKVTDENFNTAIGIDEIQDSAKIINKVLEEECNLLKDSTKVFIGGFSQGSCMALHCGREFSQKLGGILVFSGFAFPITKES